LYFKALQFCLYLWLKNRDEAEKKAEKEQGSATEHSALLRHNARALANEVICDIPVIL
jgi:hypothetical protein